MKLDTGTTDLLAELRDDGVLIATLNRPETRNAFSAAMGKALGSLYQLADSNDAVRVVVITGTPPAFCAGADFSRGSEVFERADDSEFTSNPINPPGRYVNRLSPQSTVMPSELGSHLLCNAICASLPVMRNMESCKCAGGSCPMR